MDNVPYGDSLYRYYDELSLQAELDRQQELVDLKSAEDALAHIRKSRERLARVLAGPALPAGRSPAVVTARICRNGVLIDKVLYEVRPGIFSTGLFLRPEKHNGNLPGVIGSCGHSSEGKGYQDYQRFAFSLAAKGFGVFLYDPPGQGERHSMLPGRNATIEHAAIGKALIAGGIQPATLFINDARRAIDCLLSRPEVRPGKVAVTGNSGGGQMSYYLFGMDERVEIAACSCHMNTLRTLYRNETATDPESSIIGLLGCGADRPDFAIAGAPKPLLLLGAEQDALDRRGLDAAYSEIKQIYRLLGKEENLHIHTCPGEHAFHRDLREAMYGFFTGYYFGKADPEEPELELLSLEESFVLPEGEVILHPGCRHENAFVREMISADSKSSGIDEAGAFLRQAWKLPEELPADVPDYRSIRPAKMADGSPLSRFALTFPEERSIQPVLYFAGKKSEPLIPALNGDALLYVSHLDSCREIAALAGSRQELFALDVRGTGASRSTAGRYSESDYFTPLGREYFIECTGRMLDVPLTGGRIKDLCAALALIRAAGASAPVLYGCGIGGLTAAYAAAAYELPVSKLILREVPESLDALLDRGIFRMPQSFIPFGMLQHFDLCDLYRMLSERYQLELHTSGDVPPDIQD